MVQNGFCNVQPQPAAAAVPAAGFLHPVKRGKDARQILLGDVDAAVFHGKPPLRLGHGDHRARRRVGHGVADHIGEHSLEDGIDGFLGLTWNQELAATIDRLESLDRNELRKQFSIKRLNEMEIYPGVTFSEELEGQLFASIMLDMEKLISAYRRMLRQGNHALTVIVG